MSYWMTQSLLSSWQHFLDADDLWADKSWASFLSALRREEQPLTEAMKKGIQFEDDINRTVAGEKLDRKEDRRAKAVARFSRICRGGQSQVPVSGELSIGGLDLVLYGVCDYVKAGIIYDIKRVTRYEYGKYQHSPQYSMYLHLIPSASRFDYLIFDGSFCYRESYRRGDFPPIEDTITQFIRFLQEHSLIDEYKRYWGMDEEREWKRYGV